MLFLRDLQLVLRAKAMTRLLVLALVLLSVSRGSSATRVLLAPMFGRSHFMAMNVVAEELSKRGHEVSMT